MFDWSLIVATIFNILLLSIPEETFLVLFALFLMKRYDLLELKKSNVIRIGSIAVFFAVFSNVIRLILKFDARTMPFISTVVMFILFMIVFRIKSFKGIFKALIAVTVSAVAIGSLQLLIYPIISNIIADFRFEELNVPSPELLILALPERIIEFAIIMILFLNRQSFIKISVFKAVLKNKLITYISTIIAVLNFLFVYAMYRLFYINKVLAGLSPTIQLFVIVIVIAFPIINLSVLFGTINYSVNKLNYTKAHIQEESRVLKMLIKLLLKQQRYEEISSEMDSFVEEVKKY